MPPQRPTPRQQAVARAVGVTGVAVGLTWLAKNLADASLGRDAPVVLLGVAVAGAGAVAGARAAWPTAFLLLAMWWFFYIPQSGSFMLASRESSFRLLALALETCGIAWAIGRIERGRDALRIALVEQERLTGQRAAAEAELRREAQRVIRLQALTRSLSAAVTPEEVAHAVVDHGVEVLGASTGAFARPTVGKDALEIVAQHGITAAMLSSFGTVPISAHYPIPLAFSRGEPEWVESKAEAERRYGDFGKRVGGEAAAIAALPLIGSHGVQGVIAYRFDQDRAFLAEERSLLASIASQAAQAFERANLHALEIAARRRVEALSELSVALSSAVTREEVVKIVLERGMSVAGADTATLYALDERAEHLRLLGERGCAPQVVAQIAVVPRLPQNPTFESFVERRSLFAESEADYRTIYPSLVSIKADGPRAQAFWSVPLVVEGEAIGLLGMGFYQPRRFPPDERTFVETFARHCAQALRRAERVAAERSARAVAEQLQNSFATTLRSIGDAVIATDASGRVTFLNGVAEALSEWTEAEARGRPLREVFRIIDERTRHEVEPPTERVLREGIIVGLANHTVLVGKNGRETPIDDSGAPIRADSGDITGVVLVFRDVSEKKLELARQGFLSEASALLSQSLDHRATLSRLVQLVVPRLADWCAVDLVQDGGATQRLAVAHVDPSKLRLAEELDRRHPEDPQAGRGVPHVIKTGQSELYAELTPELLDNSTIDPARRRILRELNLRSAMVVPLAVRSRVLGAMTFVYAESPRRYDAMDLAFAEELARRAASAIDNAQLYAAEQRARTTADAANRAKDQFLATVSHELRTPLNAIMGWAKLLRNGLDSARQARAVETIDRNAVAMARLIEDLLDSSRIISGKMRLELEPVEFATIVSAVLESTRPAADTKQVSLSANLSRVEFLADPARLQQIVWNLLNNAVKFTPPGGHVSVTLSADVESARLCVVDDGSGIDPAFLRHVFEPFRQADGTRTRKHGGLGLGLAITQQLAELHGGRIEAASAGLGRGATFTVELPLVRERATEPSTAQTAFRANISTPLPAASPLEGLHVLAVDDDEDARHLVATVLEGRGCKVVSAKSVQDAVNVLEQERPSLLISDIGMPGADGYDLIRHLRELPVPLGGIPAIALTAFSSAADRFHALNEGFTLHLQKPIDPEELVRAVAELARFSAPASIRPVR